ncbi:unnamed protein product, partial [Rotaria sordida]
MMNEYEFYIVAHNQVGHKISFELRHLIPPTIGIIVKSSSFFSSLHQYDGLVPDHPE